MDQEQSFVHPSWVTISDEVARAVEEVHPPLEDFQPARGGQASSHQSPH